MDMNVKTGNISCFYICKQDIVFYYFWDLLVVTSKKNYLFFRLLVRNVVHLFVYNCVGYIMA